MATYAFKAIDPQGGHAHGEVEGTDEKAVSSQLRSRGLIVLKVEEQKPADVGDLFARFKPVRAGELAIFSRQLATMVNAGLPMLRALYALEEQATKEKLKNTIMDVRKSVEAGSSLSDALARHPSVFDELYVAMVRAGETGGILDQTLLRIADQLEKAESLRRQIRAAMVYPMLIGFFAFAVLIGLVAFLIPVFEKVFKELPEAGELPAITKISVGMSHLITDRWYLLIGGTMALVIGFRQWKKSKAGRAQWDRIKLRIPFRIGKVVHKVALARFSRTFSGLVSGGVPVLEAIDITSRTAGNTVVEEAMVKVHESVKGGGTISAPMRDSPHAFPTIVPHMVEIGETTGALDDMLDKIAEFYEDEVASAVKALSSLLEPVMLVLIGGIVGFIVISMYLPMFEIYDKLR